jgi:heme exporter protein A
MYSHEGHEATPASLRAEGLACSRGDRALFAGLSFCLESRGVLMVRGRNGSGKTSLLRVLCGMRAPDEGRVTWADTCITRLGARYNRELAYVGHTDGIKRELTVYENLRMARSLGRAGDRPLDDALRQVGLDRLDDMPAAGLSAGQRRRLALARLLVTRAQLWLLDEPFASLDSDGVEIFAQMVQAHTSAGGMVVMTAHHEIDLGAADVQRIELQ